MADARIFTTDGKSTGGAKKFGMTIKDRQDVAHPNMTQTTIIPFSGTIQNQRFVLAVNATGTAVTTEAALGPVGGESLTTSLTMTPDLVLVATRMYQLVAQLTIVIQPLDNAAFISGHYVLTSAAKGVSLIGGGNGYRLDTICSETGMDTYIDETAITLTSDGTNFIITVTPLADVVISCDVIADITVNSAIFTAPL